MKEDSSIFHFAYQQSIFENLENEDDEDLELENMASKYPRLKKPNRDDNLNDSDDDSDVDSDDMEATPNGKRAPAPVQQSSEESDSEQSSSDSENSDYDVHEDFNKETPEDQPAPGGKGQYSFWEMFISYFFHTMKFETCHRFEMNSSNLIEVNFFTDK